MFLMYGREMAEMNFNIDIIVWAIKGDIEINIRKSRFFHLKIIN